MFGDDARVDAGLDVGGLHIRLCRLDGQGSALQCRGNQLCLGKQILALGGNVGSLDRQPGQRGGQAHADGQYDQETQEQAGTDGRRHSPMV